MGVVYRLVALVVLLVVAWAVAAAPMPYTLVETGAQFAHLQEAVAAIGPRAGTIRVAAGVWRDCAVITAGDVAVVAASPGQVVFDDTVCEGKAVLVARGHSLRVEGLIFRNLHIAEGNGAGIRLERGNLAVRQTWFRDSDEGILSADDPAAQAEVVESTFTRLGRCDRGLSCAHGVYFGNIAAVTIRRTRFEEGRGGHYVKSRAARIDVSDCSFDDARGQTTNYMIDLSVGASGRITGNWMVVGGNRENATALIANAAEGHLHRADGLVITGNTARLAPGVVRGTSFLVDWSGDRIALGANALGSGVRRFERR